MTHLIAGFLHRLSPQTSFDWVIVVMRTLVCRTIARAKKSRLFRTVAFFALAFCLPEDLGVLEVRTTMDAEYYIIPGMI